MITAFVRTIILYLLIMVGMRLMGKRQIGELEPSELVLTMMISDLAAVPMQDFGIPLLSGFIPILTLLALSMLLQSTVSPQPALPGTDLRHALPFSIRDGEIQQACHAEKPLHAGRAAGGAAGAGHCQCCRT